MPSSGCCCGALQVALQGPPQPQPHSRESAVQEEERLQKEVAELRRSRVQNGTLFNRIGWEREIARGMHMQKERTELSRLRRMVESQPVSQTRDERCMGALPMPATRLHCQEHCQANACCASCACLVKSRGFPCQKPPLGRLSPAS